MSFRISLVSFFLPSPFLLSPFLEPLLPHSYLRAFSISWFQQLVRLCAYKYYRVQCTNRRTQCLFFWSALLASIHLSHDLDIWTLSSTWLKVVFPILQGSICCCLCTEAFLCCDPTYFLFCCLCSQFILKISTNASEIHPYTLFQKSQIVPSFI